MSDFYEAFRISGCWYKSAGSPGNDITVRGVSLYVACQLYVFQLLAPELAGNTQSGVLVKFLKKKGLDWHLKLAASRFSAAPELAAGAGVRFIALYDTHNNAMVESVGAVARLLAADGHSVIPVTSDPKIARRAAGSTPPLGYSRYYRFSDELECRRIWRGNLRMIKAAVHRLRQDCSGLAANSIDLLALQGHLMNCLKQTVRDIIALDNLYREIDPDAVIMGSDSHKLGRISALLSRKYRWRSLVLQHGAPMLPHAYVPVYADWIAVWGESFKKWFLRHEVPEAKIVVTGSPRFDCYQAKPEPEQRRKMIWLTTPLNEETIRRCFCRILPALTALELELVIKPHPSEPAEIYSQLIAEADCTTCSVLTGVQVKDVIGKGDLVFCLNSTAGIEAIALGGLLFVIDITSVPNSIPYEQHRVAQLLRETTDVVAAIGEFSTWAATPEYQRVAEGFIGNYLGLLDGNSARRVCDFIVGQIDRTVSERGGCAG